MEIREISSYDSYIAHNSGVEQLINKPENADNKQDRAASSDGRGQVVDYQA